MLAKSFNESKKTFEEVLHCPCYDYISHPKIKMFLGETFPDLLAANKEMQKNYQGVNANCLAVLTTKSENTKE